MFRENLIDKIFRTVKKIIPRSVFGFLAPIYHWKLALIGAIWYGFPAHKLKIIGVTGTKGKSTVVFMIARILEEQGKAVAAVGSLGFKIKAKTWPNTLKMTMPGRTKLQRFLYQAKQAGCEYVVMEVTSEGIAQSRLLGVTVDTAVFTNLHREHLESHGSFENYLKAKQKLFQKTRHIHVLNIDDPYFEKFAHFPANIKITYGMDNGLINPNNSQIKNLKLKIIGDFNEYNALATLGVADAYQLDLDRAVKVLNNIESIPGRMEIIPAERNGEKFAVVVDYAHTPDSLQAVYRNLKVALRPAQGQNPASRLIGVLGAAGGGRDKWKRPEFGKIASDYCDEIILTNEDPYDEDPDQILNHVATGIASHKKFVRIMDRGAAIKHALTIAHEGDIVIITGKGSETSIALANGKKLPWSDKQTVTDYLQTSN